MVINNVYAELPELIVIATLSLFSINLLQAYSFCPEYQAHEQVKLGNSVC